MISISGELETNLSNVANKEELVVEQSESVRPFNTVRLISYLNKFKGCFDILCSYVWTHSLLTFFITYHYP